MKTKILYIIGSLDIGGAEGHLVEIAPRLDPNRFEVSIFTLTHAGMLASDLEKNGIKVITPSRSESHESGRPIRTAIRVFRSALTLISYLRQERPDIVHCYLPLPYLVGGPCGVLVGVPIRVMSRRSLNDYQQKYLLMPQVERYMHRFMHRIVANSQAVLSQLLDEGVTKKQLRLLYNGVDANKYRERQSRALFRKTFNVDQNAFLIVVVANLFFYKGHEDLLTALGQIRSSFSTPWQLLCVGKPLGLQQHLEQKAKELEIQSNVRFLGAQRECIPDLLVSADVGVLCSHQEGFSNSVLEGMAAGLPMIVTNVGGNAEAVVDGETGIVVPPNCPEKLAEAILHLANAPEKRKGMGDNGRQRVQQLFSIHTCVAEYEKLYEELLHERT